MSKERDGQSRETGNLTDAIREALPLIDAALAEDRKSVV